MPKPICDWPRLTTFFAPCAMTSQHGWKTCAMCIDLCNAHCTNHWVLSAHWQACRASTHIHIPALQSADSGHKRKRAESDAALVQAELQQECGLGSAQQTDPPCRLSDEQWLSVTETVQAVKVAALISFSRLQTAHISSSPSPLKASISSKLYRPLCGWQQCTSTRTFQAVSGVDTC